MDAASATDESLGHQSQKAFAQPQRAFASIEGALAVNQVVAPHPAPAGFFAQVSAGILTGLDGPHSDEAGRQLQKNIERRAQRRVKNQIWRDIDQALPERFRSKAVRFRNICQRSICESVVQLSAREEERRPGESPQAPPSNAPGNAVAQDKCQPGENSVRLRVLHFFKTGVSRGAHGGGWRWGAECSESHLNQASSIVPQDDEPSIRFELPPPFAADPLLDTGGTASTWAAAARQGSLNDISNDEASHAAPRRIIPAAEYVSFDFQVMTVLESNAKTNRAVPPKRQRAPSVGGWCWWLRLILRVVACMAVRAARFCWNRGIWK